MQSDANRTLDPGRTARLRGEVNACGSVFAAAKKLGISRDVLTRVLAGLPVRSGSFFLVRAMVDALDAPPAPPPDPRVEREKVFAWARTTPLVSDHDRPRLLRHLNEHIGPERIHGVNPQTAKGHR